MTQLGSITNNHLSITCKCCQHHTLMPVQFLIEKLGWETRLQNIIRRFTCKHCKAIGQIEYQIVYVGGSGEAMLGAESKQHPKSTGVVQNQ